MGEKQSISVPTGLGAKTALFSFRQTNFHSHELFKSFSLDTRVQLQHTHTFAEITHGGPKQYFLKRHCINDVSHVT